MLIIIMITVKNTIILRNVQMYKMWVIIIKNTIKLQNKSFIFTSTLIQCKHLVIRLWIICLEKTYFMA